MNILAILILILGLLLGVWLLWNVLEVIYRVVMITVCTVAYIAITIYEWIAFVVRWTLIKPIAGMVTLARR